MDGHLLFFDIHTFIGCMTWGDRMINPAHLDADVDEGHSRRTSCVQPKAMLFTSKSWPETSLSLRYCQLSSEEAQPPLWCYLSGVH